MKPNIFRDILLTLFSSILFILTSYGLGFLIWIAFVPLIIAFNNNKNKFRLAIFFPILFGLTAAPFFYNVVIDEAFTFLIGSIVYVIFFFFMIFLVSFILFKRISNYLEVFITPLVFIVLFIIMGYTKYGNFIINLAVIEPSLNLLLKFIGVYGLNFLIVLFNSVIAFYIIRKNKPLIIPIIIVLVILIINSLYQPTIISDKEINIALVQGNLPFSWEWRHDNSNYIFEVYRNLTLDALKFKPKIIIWPEYTLIGDFNYKKLEKLSQEANATIIVGIANYLNGKNFKDSALVISKDSILMHNATYVFPSLQEYAVASNEKPHTYNIENLNFGILICAEEASHLGVNYGEQNADFIVSISNNQHFNDRGLKMLSGFTRMVSSQISKYTIRATNNGITQVIDSNGNVIKSLEPNKRGYLIATISTNNEKTFYSEYGNFPLYLILVILFTLIIKEIMKNS